VTAAKLDKEGRKYLWVERGYVAEGGDVGFHEGQSGAESLRRLHVGIHHEKITIRHKTGKPDILAGRLNLYFPKDIKEELEEFGIGTIDVRAGKGNRWEYIRLVVVHEEWRTAIEGVVKNHDFPLIEIAFNAFEGCVVLESFDTGVVEQGKESGEAGEYNQSTTRRVLEPMDVALLEGFLEVLGVQIVCTWSKRLANCGQKKEEEEEREREVTASHR
jgi:hypothetical protein